MESTIYGNSCICYPNKKEITVFISKQYSFLSFKKNLAAEMLRWMTFPLTFAIPIPITRIAVAKAIRANNFTILIPI